MQLEEANAAKEGEVALRRKAEEDYLEMKEKVQSIDYFCEHVFCNLLLWIYVNSLPNLNIQLCDRYTSVQLEEANAAKEQEVFLRRMTENVHLELKEKVISTYMYIRMYVVVTSTVQVLH